MCVCVRDILGDVRGKGEWWSGDFRFNVHDFSVLLTVSLGVGSGEWGSKKEKRLDCRWEKI